MGYILPITQFEYKDYQNRDIKDKQIIPNIERSYKVILKMQQEQMDAEYYKYQFTEKKRSIPSDETSSKMSKSEKIYADLTGKGALFSESI